jgi:hypothetical protein
MLNIHVVFLVFLLSSVPLAIPSWLACPQEVQEDAVSCKRSELDANPCVEIMEGCGSAIREEEAVEMAISQRRFGQLVRRQTKPQSPTQVQEQEIKREICLHCSSSTSHLRERPFDCAREVRDGDLRAIWREFLERNVQIGT